LWAYQRGVTLDFSRPGKPTDNAFIESFNGKFRAECLNAHWFMSLDDARRKCEAWRRDYNEERPHSAIGNKAPIELVNRSGGRRPALTETGWKKTSSLVQGWGAVQMKPGLYSSLDERRGSGHIWRTQHLSQPNAGPKRRAYRLMTYGFLRLD